MQKIYGFIIFLVLNTSCRHHHYCTTQNDIQKNHIVIKEKEIDSTVYKTILPYKNKIDNDLNIKIAYTYQPIVKNTECNNLAQLVFESMKFYTGSVWKKHQNYFILINYGGLRADIPQGNIFKKSIFELMPFDNTIVIIELTDEQKKILLQKAQANKKLLLKHNSDTSANILVTSDYLYYGGDDCGFLKTAKMIHSSNYFIRDAIINYCIFKKELNISCFY